MHADGALGVNDLADLRDGSSVDLGVAVSKVGLTKNERSCQSRKKADGKWRGDVLLRYRQ